MISQISLNSWKQRKERREERGGEGKGQESRREGKRKIFQFLQMDCTYTCFVLPSMPRKAIYNSILVFPYCLCRDWKLARGESLGSSYPFFVHTPKSGHVRVFLDCPEFVEAFQSLYSSKHLILQPFLPNFSCCLLFAWTVFLCPKLAPNNMPSNVFKQYPQHPTSHLRPPWGGMSQSWER